MEAKELKRSARAVENVQTKQPSAPAALIRADGDATRQYGIILDELRELVRVCDTQDHRVLYMNAAARCAYAPYCADGAASCHVAFYGRDTPCPGCVERTDAGFLSGSHIDPRDNRRYFTRSCLMEWEGRPARLTIQVDADSEEGRWIDELTGVGSRAAFYRDAGQISEAVGIVVVDVDDMAAVNESRGRAGGDKMLKGIAALLTREFAWGGVYRMGDDEFCVAVPGMGRAQFVAEAMRTARELDANGLPASLGYAWDEDAVEATPLVFRAMRRMRQTKRARALSRRTGWDPSLAGGLSGLLRPQGAAHAARDHAFAVWLQPQVHPVTRGLVGAEALVRYIDPRTGEVVPPIAFVGPLEDMGEIDDVDFFVFDRVCAATARWKANGFPACKLSANFSRRTLEKPGFAQRIERIADAHQVRCVSLEIEVTESAREADPEGLARVVNDLRRGGFAVAVDDFGTDNANLSLFSTLEFDVLKLDKSLIDKVAEGERARKAVELLARMCADLGIESVAEGVEDERQLDVLRAAGVTRIQGYLTGRPMPLNDFEKLLAADAAGKEAPYAAHQ